MPNVSEVRPEKWSQVADLYDDGEYSPYLGALRRKRDTKVRCSLERRGRVRRLPKSGWKSFVVCRTGFSGQVDSFQTPGVGTG